MSSSNDCTNSCSARQYPGCFAINDSAVCRRRPSVAGSILYNHYLVLSTDILRTINYSPLSLICKELKMDRKKRTAILKDQATVHSATNCL